MNWRVLQLVGLYLCIALLALWPRVADLGGFITHDEAEFWIDRSHLFRNALRDGDYAATAITTHPGVTTMWLGSAGIVLREQLFAAGLLHNDPFPTVLALMRLPVAITHVLALLLGFWLLRQWLPAGIATLAALLWATDPFVIGYSRLLHVDALAASFATLSLLALAVYRQQRSPRMMLLLSSVCAALAILSKSPALVLLPIVGGALLLWHKQRALLPLLIWGSAATATLVLVWPAVWAAPADVYRLLRIGVDVEGAQPHMTGNFFLGQRNDAPGWLFYPVALVLRQTPWSLIGLLLLPLPLLCRPSPPTPRG
ncbi:MAG: phospholipid carrier-dependent glycosyltransferase [Chloroflexaceae bacterium]|nr:phospholipid carrier-dependent glycosyltransferase [Chloroflexaceae bacterium]